MATTAQVLTDRRISGADLARNPLIALAAARALNRNVNQILSGTGRGGRTPSLEPMELLKRGGSGTYRGTPFLFDFFTAQNRLRQEFINAEVDRLFPFRNVTSQSSTVGSGGERAPIPGQPGFGVGPTAAQLDEIAARFQTPLQVLRGGTAEFGPLGLQPVGEPSGEPGGAKRPRPKTIVSSPGQKRRRIPRGAPAKTILTSDADAEIGGRTILG